MKHLIVSVALAVALLPAAVPAAGLTFPEVVDAVDRNAHTKLNIKDYWGEVRGKEVTWSGVVYDVEPGKSHVRILVTDKSRPLYHGYNIRVYTQDRTKASNLKRGQRIQFRGLLHNYHSKDAGAVIDVNEATVY